jgi:HD domain
LHARAESNIKERAMCQTKLRKPINRRTFLNATTTAAGAIAVSSQLSEQAVAQPVDESLTFRRPKTIIPLPTPSLEFQHVADGVPDTKMTREATGLLREFSTPVLINHSHRVFFWANEMGRQTGQKFDVELVFICAAFHDFGLLKKFSSATDRFEVDGANAVRQFLEHHGVPNARIQTAWDAISLHTTPGIAAYKPLEVELLYNGVALDSLGVGYETFPEDVRNKVVSQFPRANFKKEISEAFFNGFGYKPQTTEYTCNEDICSHFIRNYQRRNFYDQVMNSPFPNS